MAQCAWTGSRHSAYYTTIVVPNLGYKLELPGEFSFLRDADLTGGGAAWALGVVRVFQVILICS